MILEQNINPILFNLGSLNVHWYGLFFAVGLSLAFFISSWIFKREKFKTEDLESIVLYMFIGLVLGARLGHIIFYDLDYYLSNPLKIFKIWEGGLASHGAAIGLFLAYTLWIFIHKVKFTKYIDAISISIPLAASFVRLGNYFNSEIVGKATDGTWGVVFLQRGESFPRHPSQIYEWALSLAIFIILFYLYKKYYKKTANLFFMFLYILLYFSSRFFVEFFKERQVIPESIPLSMGQILSILPVFIALIYFIGFYPRMKKRS